MEDFQFLCRASDLRDGEFRELKARVNDLPSHVVATRHRGQPRAWLNVCPHQGRPLNWAPDRFLVDDQGRLVCAAHGAVFEIDHGVCVAGPCVRAALTAIELTEDGDSVYFKPSR